MAVGSREQGSVPDIEGLAGPARAEAMLKKAYGEELFDRDATAYVEVRYLEGEAGRLSPCALARALAAARACPRSLVTQHCGELRAAPP